jgi:hypothetical protein
MLYHSMAITGRPGVPYSRALAMLIALLRCLSRPCDSDRALAIPIAPLRFRSRPCDSDRTPAIPIALLRFRSHSCDSDRALAIPIAPLRFEGPTPGWFSRPSGRGGFQPVTPSLLDLSQAVLVPVSAFIRSLVAVPSAARPVLRFARLYHLTAVSQGTTAGGFRVSGLKVSGFRSRCNWVNTPGAKPSADRRIWTNWGPESGGLCPPEGVVSQDQRCGTRTRNRAPADRQTVVLLDNVSYN